MCIRDSLSARKRHIKTSRGSQLEVQLASNLDKNGVNADPKVRESVQSQHRVSGEKLTESNSNNNNLMGIGLLSAAPYSQQKSPSSAAVALSDKYAVRVGKHQHQPVEQSATTCGSRKNLKQREILSSAESANHFITKTRVAGQLRNTRQVVAPVGLAGPKLAHPPDIQDFL